MENAIDALHMAAGFLIFIVALAISINAFGQARVTAEIILSYKDREYDYTYVDSNVDADGNLTTERIVRIRVNHSDHQQVISRKL